MEISQLHGEKIVLGLGFQRSLAKRESFEIKKNSKPFVAVNKVLKFSSFLFNCLSLSLYFFYLLIQSLLLCFHRVKNKKKKKKSVGREEIHR